MKKFSLFTVLMALAMFAFVFAANAQVEEYLGTWYMEEICEGEECMNLAAFGVSTALVINEDNTCVIDSGVDEPDVTTWYEEDGVIYMIGLDEEGNEVPSELAIVDGRLMIGDETGTVYFTRESIVIPGTGYVVEDATLEQFAGEWHLYGMVFDGNVTPVSFFGIEGTLTITEDSVSVDFMGETEEMTYVLEGGMILAVSETVDEDNNPVESLTAIVYLDDDSIVVTDLSGEEDEQTVLVFTREAVESDFTLESLFEEIDWTDEENEAMLESLMTELTAEAEKEGIDLDNLFAEIGSELGAVDGESIDFGALLTEVDSKLKEEGIDLEALASDFSSKLEEEGIDLSGLFNSLTGEGEGFNLGGLVEALTTSENGK